MTRSQTPHPQIGVIVIGRNEGERLKRCFESLGSTSRTVVYVDSGSSDDSVSNARTRGIEVVELDMGTPFTAARARNAGFHALLHVDPGVRFVQFVDGDCELIDGWLEDASAFLDARADVACVCGRLHERFPERSIYNRMCDREWGRPAGPTAACGGIAMLRSRQFSDVGGFNEKLVAGEEPELCQRLQAQGSVIWRMPQAMAFHDADILHFSQWWKRCKRVGFAYAQSVWLHGGRSDRDEWAKLLRPWMWGAVLPVATAIGAVLWGKIVCALLLAYPVNVIRQAAKGTEPWKFRLTYSAFLMLGKIPELLGECQFWLNARRNVSSLTFDYKAR